MTFDEALTKIVEIIPSEKMGDFDEVLETVKSSQTNDNSWEEKYNDLVEKYKKRFTDSLNKEVDKEETKTDNNNDEIEPTVDNLDFSAESE